MSQLNSKVVEDKLKGIKDEWLDKYRGLIVQDKPEPVQQNPMAAFFGGPDKKLTDAPLGWGDGTALPGAPRLDGLKTTIPERFREGEAVIDLVENDEGQRMIAKIDRSDSFGHGAQELAVYQHIYETAGHHPNLAQVHGLAVVQHGMGKMPALIMDEVVGDPGEKAMRKLNNAWKKGDISAAEFWGAIQFMGRRLLEVVHHLQDAGIAHNDIKPENFVVDSTTGEPVLIDLGLHSALGSRAPGGTEGYTAPQVMTRGVTTESTDVYSVGRSLQRGLGGLAGGLETEVVQSLAALASGRSGKLNPEDGASLDFFADHAVDDDVARQILARVVSTDEARPQTGKTAVDDTEAEKLSNAWIRNVKVLGRREELVGARGRTRLEWLQQAEDLLARAKSDGVDGRAWNVLRSRVEECMREMDDAAREFHDPPEPVKWTPDWKPTYINSYTLDIMATAIQQVIDEAGALLNEDPHPTTLHLVISLHERADVLLRSLRAYVNALTPPNLPKAKDLKRLKKKGKTLPPWEALGDMETARQLFTTQFERLQPVAEQLADRGAKLGIELANAGAELAPLLNVDWYDRVRDADATFHDLQPVVFNTLDDEREQQVREFHQAAQVAWQVIGPLENVMQQWLKTSIEQCRKLGNGLLPDDELTNQRTELRSRITVVGRALGIERDWILRPGGQPAPPPDVGMPPRPTKAILVELRDLRAKIEAASVAPERSIRIRAKDLALLGEELEGYGESEDNEVAPLVKATRDLWKRCVARVKKQNDEALNGARKLIAETTPDHVWRTLNSIQVHLEHMSLERPNTRWFQRELEALARLATQIQRYLSLVGDALDEKEEQQLIELLKAMDGFEELERRFELEARQDPAIPEQAPDRSELSQQMDVVMNDLQQAASAPWPQVDDFSEKLRRRLASVQDFTDRIKKLDAPVRGSGITEDIEQFEQLIRVRMGIEQALKDRLGS